MDGRRMSRDPAPMVSSSDGRFRQRPVPHSTPGGTRRDTLRRGCTVGRSARFSAQRRENGRDACPRDCVDDDGGRDAPEQRVNDRPWLRWPVQAGTGLTPALRMTDARLSRPAAGRTCSHGTITRRDGIDLSPDSFIVTAGSVTFRPSTSCLRRVGPGFRSPTGPARRQAAWSPDAGYLLPPARDGAGRDRDHVTVFLPMRSRYRGRWIDSPGLKTRP